MKALSILALAAATFAAPMAWAGQTAVTVTQIAGPSTSVPTQAPLPITITFNGESLTFTLQAIFTN